MLNKIIAISFYILFFFTPLFWLPFNFELFEYNKMMMVYGLTIIITTAWLITQIRSKKLILKRTPLDIPLLIFLLANILSTIFSIDPHTSIWGYYSRSNGGLLSTFSYILLYYALISNFEKEQAIKFLKTALLGGLVVSLWAVPEHFGVSPSCVILTGELSASCWVQNVEARVFATLGQPNWLAGYLSMLIFPAFYFLLTSTTRLSTIRYMLYAILFYLAFTFTKSRGGALGLFGGLGLFLSLFIYHQIKIKQPGQALTKIGVALMLIFIISIFYGSALTSRFEGIGSALSRQAPAATQQVRSGQTQLEIEGGETPKIRFIVWQGALEIFKHYPVFGSGVETFAYSYYNFRPQSHNLTSEWGFLYNKAHNEFLNYLATTGIAGFASYMAVILTFILWSVKRVMSYGFGAKNQSLPTHHSLLITSLLASYISYLIQNFFSFSVVVIALFFYLFPALAFMATGSTKPFSLPKQLYAIRYTLYALLYRRSLYPKIAQAFIFILAFLLILRLISYYQADIFYAQGTRANETDNPGRAYNALIEARTLNKQEPLYKSELGYAAAGAAVSLAEEDATSSSQLKSQAVSETEEALKISPKNVSLYRTKVRTYYMLSTIDKSYLSKTLEALDQTIRLAPTDAKLTYNKAVILGQEKRNREAIENLKKTIMLRPNYRDAYYSLGLFYFEEGQKEQAEEQMKSVLKLVPNDPEAMEKLKEWGR